MTEVKVVLAPQNAIAPVFDWFAAAAEYTVDVAQRTILFWDVMRQRGNEYRAHMAETAQTCSTSRLSLSLTVVCLNGPSIIVWCGSCRRPVSKST